MPEWYPLFDEGLFQPTLDVCIPCEYAGQWERLRMELFSALSGLAELISEQDSNSISSRVDRSQIRRALHE